MKIGVILVGYNMEEHMAPCLWPWVNWQYSPASAGHEMFICAVNAPFAGFPVEPPDQTRRMLDDRIALHEIDHLITSDTVMKETDARGAALKWLALQKVDVYWQVDLDEFYTIDQITAIVKFVAAKPFATWFRLCLKNYVFDKQTYLTQPFTPPRIHRDMVGAAGSLFWADSFWDDNNVLYRGRGELKPEDLPTARDVQLPSLTVPKPLAWIPHYSWLNDDRSRRKIQYQLQGRGWPQCSFAWDDSKGGLIWNPALPIPETARDDSA